MLKCLLNKRINNLHFQLLILARLSPSSLNITKLIDLFQSLLSLFSSFILPFSILHQLRYLLLILLLKYGSLYNASTLIEIGLVFLLQSNYLLG